MQVYALFSMQNLGDARFLSRDLLIIEGLAVVPVIQIIPLLFFKNLFRAKRSSSQHLGTQPEFHQYFGAMGRSAGFR